ncbi:sigma-54-dependent Fis family transcriptional regulator [candidate division TA06 bacterium]|nr:sigma-54-dependent Fis family transcriptional regulator [candidate division TA06 bacterium]
MIQKTVLIGEDEKDMQGVLSEILKNRGFETFSASDGEEVLDELRKKTPDVVLLDIRMPKMDGLKTLEKMRKMNLCIPVVMMTAYGDIPSAVQAMRLGAVDYITKPFNNDDIVECLYKALESVSLAKEISTIRDQQIASLSRINGENVTLRDELEYLRKEREENSLMNQMGTSPEIQRVIHQVEQVADTDFTIVFQGETGTGKELVSQAVHQLSRRRGNPFVAVDCGAIPDTLIESELFGYEKGAFTGAHRTKEGYFEQANTGTLFLDEIANIAKTTQRKLLRVLQERKIQHLGGKIPIPVDVRVIAATNVDLEGEVKRGQFREDLYYRLNEFSITLPPLRERKEDIPYLANRFLKEANQELRKKVREFTGTAIVTLNQYPWPGNVRELKNVIKRAVLLSSDRIDSQHLAPLIAKDSTEIDSSEIHLGIKKGLSLSEITRKVTDQVEKDVIQRVLKTTEGKKSKAAQFLGIDYKTLYRKLKQYGIDANPSD